MHLPKTKDKAQIHIKEDHTQLSQQIRASLLQTSIRQSFIFVFSDDKELKALSEIQHVNKEKKLANLSLFSSKHDTKTGWLL